MIPVVIALFCDFNNHRLTRKKGKRKQVRDMDSKSCSSEAATVAGRFQLPAVIAAFGDFNNHLELAKKKEKGRMSVGYLHEKTAFIA